MEIYAIRHGQSESNGQQIYSGWSQVHLTEKGIQDAKNAGILIQDIRFDRIISSDLVRAIQTAQIAIPGCEPEQDPLLREINVGELAGKTQAECLAFYGDSFIPYRDARDYTPYGGENIPLHAVRTAEFLRGFETADSDQKIAVFAHAGTIRGMLNYVLGTDIRFDRIDVFNGSVSVFHWNGKHWSLRLWNQILVYPSLPATVHKPLMPPVRQAASR